MFLSQTQYALKILERAGMSSCHPPSTPVDTSPKLAAAAGPPVADPSAYRSLAGALQYLTFTRPDIAYAVQQVCLHMHDPREQHLSLLKRVLRYVKGTLHHGLQLASSPTDRLVAYTDADWAGCPDTRRFTSGYCVFLGDNLVSWSSKRQQPSPAPAPKRNIEPSLMPSLKPAGSDNSSMSCIALYPPPPLFFVTT